LAAHFGTLGRLQQATQEELDEVDGVGEVVARSVREWFLDPAHQAELANLVKHLHIEESARADGGVLDGQTVVVTGTLPTLSRDAAEELVRAHGGKASSSVSKNTSFVVVGENAGSKASKAAQLGIEMLDEAAFLSRITRT
jgi:DNA ligase (NAD+)